MNIQFEEQKHALEHLQPEIKDLAEALGIEKLTKELDELTAQASAPDFWNNNDNSQVILQRSKVIRQKLDDYNKLVKSSTEISDLIDVASEMDDDSVIPEIIAGVKKIQADLESQRLSTLLTGEYDSNNAILAFHSGAGGTEAQDWAEMLYRMYTRWAERHGYSVKVLNYLDGEEAGLKSASILIEGANVYGYLKAESGVHRLVRISPFDSSGRRHTSFASIEVMPEISNDLEVKIEDKDLRIDTYRSSGAGGQHVNTTDSAIRITHIPTGIVVSCQNERSQHQNREVAMKMLLSKLAEIKEREHLEHIDDIKGDHKDNAWGSQIRSYVFMPYTLAKDHRTNYEEGNISAVMDGEIDGFINAYLKAKSLGQL